MSSDVVASLGLLHFVAKTHSSINTKYCAVSTKYTCVSVSQNYVQSRGPSVRKQQFSFAKHYLLKQVTEVLTGTHSSVTLRINFSNEVRGMKWHV
jgi:hypothetical protein